MHTEYFYEVLPLTQTTYNRTTKNILMKENTVGWLYELKRKKERVQSRMHHIF